MKDKYGRLPDHPCYGCETTEECWLVCCFLQEVGDCPRLKRKGKGEINGRKG